MLLLKKRMPMDDLVERLTYAKLRELRERVAGMPCYDSDGDPAGLFDHHVFVRHEDVLRLIDTMIQENIRE